MSDPYLGEVGLHLAEPTADTEQELKRVASLPGWQPPARLQRPIQSARDWCSAILRAQFQPPPSAPFVGFEAESGLCDTIRCQYQAGGYDLHVAQTRYVFCVQVRTSQKVGVADSVALVTRLAPVILELDQPIQFTQSGDLNQGKWGRRLMAKDALADPDYPGWAEELRWWCLPDRVTFLTLKSSGGPTREVIHPALSFNRHWFPKAP